MKYIPLLFFSLLFWKTGIHAQSSLNFSVEQLPLLIADAGKDSVVLKGSKIRLGGPVVATGGSGNYQYSWSPAAGLDSPFIARPTATADTSITYQLTVDDKHSCKKSASIKLTVNRITAIPDVFNQSGITLFPNPARGYFHIVSEKVILEKKITIQLVDMSGREVYFHSITGNRRLNEQIRVRVHLTGVYFLKISGGKNQFIRKIIFL